VGAVVLGAGVWFSGDAALADFKIVESNVESLPVGTTIQGKCVTSVVPAGGKVKFLDLSSGTTKTLCGSSPDCASVPPWEQIGGLRKPCDPNGK